MKNQILKLTITTFTLFLVACSGTSKQDNSALLLPLLFSGKSTIPSTGSSSSSSTTSSSSSYISFYSGYANKSSLVSGESATFPVTVYSTTYGPKDYSLDLYLSTDSSITSSDIKIGTISVNNQTSNTQNLIVAIPNTLVLETADRPVKYYYGFLSGSTSQTSYSSLIVYPYKSKLESFSLGIPTASTFNAEDTQIFYEFSVTSNASKITLSTFLVSAGLDTALSVYQYSSGSGTYVNVGPEKNENGANAIEFISLTSGGSFNSAILRVRKVSGTGTYKASGMANVSYYLPFTSLSKSCAGGTGVFANRCVTYLDINPTNNAGCESLQGAGSVYSSSSCTSTNVVRRCYANPLSNSSRAVINFYSATDTVSTADALCGGDISM